MRRTLPLHRRIARFASRNPFIDALFACVFGAAIGILVALGI